MVLSFFSLPLYMSFFNNSVVLGLWYTLLSVLTWINMFDFGLTNGLRNRLVKPIEEHQYAKISEYISSTVYALIVISAIILAGGLALLLAFDINNLLNVSDATISYAGMRITTVILLIGITVSFILKVNTSINYALQVSFVNDINTFLSSLIPLLFIVFTRKLEISLDNKLIIMAIVHVIATWLPTLVSFVVVKHTNSVLSQVKLSCQYMNHTVAKDITKFGVSFFVVQAAFLLITQTNEFMISAFFSPDVVVSFRAYNSLFLIVGSIFQVALSPVWSSVTKASIQKDFVWLRKLQKKLYFVSLLAFFVELLVVPFTGTIFRIWLKENAVPVDYRIAFLFAVYGGLYILNVVVTTVANGLGKLKIQTIFYSIGAVMKIPIVYFSSKLFPNSWFVVILVNVVALLIFCLAQTIWLHRFIQKVS